jgi:hypothetical protein
VAVGSGIGYAQIHGFIAGERKLSLDAVDRICEYFGLTLTSTPAEPSKKKEG